MMGAMNLVTMLSAEDEGENSKRRTPEGSPF
jgi:hypothetical protein